MVLFDNITLNQNVHVRHNGYLLNGIVRFKGKLNCEKGEWVGIELDYPYGKHNGTWRGQHYFSSAKNCGLFTHASKVRFVKMTRRRFDNYRKIYDDSEIDETLFSSEYLEPVSKQYVKTIDRMYLRRARSAFKDPPHTNWFCTESRFPLSHSVGNSIPSPMNSKPEIAIKKFQYYSEPIHYEYATLNNFNPLATIPHYGMPHEALKRFKNIASEDNGKSRKTMPRFSTV